MARPLEGRRIVNTRAPHQAADLDDLLVSYGAIPISYPCIDIAAPPDPAGLDRAIQDAAQGHFDWLVLTSANTVYALAARLRALGLHAGALAGIPTAAVGPATAELAREMLGVDVSLTPDEHVAEALVAALDLPPGARVFLPQSDLARPVLHGRLAAAGLEVTAVAAYHTVPGSGGDNVPALLAQGQIDAVVFTSSSTVENFMARLRAESHRAPALDGVCIACIGPITARAAQALGLAVHVMPETYTLEGLVQKLADHFDEAMNHHA